MDAPPEGFVTLGTAKWAQHLWQVFPETVWALVVAFLGAWLALRIFLAGYRLGRRSREPGNDE